MTTTTIVAKNFAVADVTFTRTLLEPGISGLWRYNPTTYIGGARTLKWNRRAAKTDDAKNVVSFVTTFPTVDVDGKFVRSALIETTIKYVNGETLANIQDLHAIHVSALAQADIKASFNADTPVNS